MYGSRTPLMYPKASIVIFLLLLPIAPFGNAQTVPADHVAHCDYVLEQGTAQRDLLRTPAITTGFTQPETGLAEQYVVGITESLANVKKAKIAMDVARTNCALYASTIEARQKLFFLLPTIEKDVLHNRLDLIEDAIKQLTQMIGETSKRVDAQDMTRQSVYPLQAAVLRLLVDRTSTLTGITTPYVPPQNPAPLKDLIAQKRTTDYANQKAVAHMQKQSNWDVLLNVGLHQQVGTTSTAGESAMGAYGTVTVSYNLASSRINKHLDKSVSSYDAWQDSEFDDVAHQAEILREQISQTISVQQSQLDSLKSQSQLLDSDLKPLEGVDTDVAIAFRNQLTADNLILKVDIGDVTFRLAKVRAALATNF